MSPNSLMHVYLPMHQLHCTLSLACMTDIFYFVFSPSLAPSCPLSPSFALEIVIQCFVIKVLSKSYHSRHQTFPQSEPRASLLSLDQQGKLTLWKEDRFLQQAEHSDWKAHQKESLSCKEANKREASSCILQLQERILFCHLITGIKWGSTRNNYDVEITLRSLPFKKN